MASKFSNIDKYCLTCKCKLVLKSNRDILRKNYCSKKCLGKMRGTALFSDAEFVAKFRKQCNTKESNEKKGHKKETHSLWVGRETRKCKLCNSEIICRANSKRKYCSTKCSLEDIHTNLVGKKLVDRNTFICTICNNTFTRSVNYKSSAKYCSRKCHCIGNIYNMKKEGTNIENIIENILITENIKYDKQIPISNISVPDFKVGNILIFADGDYWHTKPDKVIKDNIQNNKLLDMGFIVLRFLGSVIENNTEYVRDKIKNEICN